MRQLTAPLVLLPPPLVVEVAPVLDVLDCAPPVVELVAAVLVPAEVLIPVLDPLLVPIDAVVPAALLDEPAVSVVPVGPLDVPLDGPADVPELTLLAAVDCTMAPLELQPDTFPSSHI